MSYDANDPKWTAYVLGELNDVERAEVEAELQADPAARTFVAEIRRTVGQLSSELTAEPCPALSEMQRDRVLHKLPDVSPAPEPESQATTASGKRGRPLVRRWLLNLAAMIVVAVGLTVLMLPSLNMVRESSRRTAPSISEEEMQELKQGVGTYSANARTAPTDGYAANVQNQFLPTEPGMKLELKYDHSLNQQIAQDKDNSETTRTPVGTEQTGNSTLPGVPFATMDRQGYISGLPGASGGGGAGGGIVGGRAYTGASAESLLKGRVQLAGSDTLSTSPPLPSPSSEFKVVNQPAQTNQSRAPHSGGRLELDGANTFTGNTRLGGTGGGALTPQPADRFVDSLPQVGVIPPPLRPKRVPVDPHDPSAGIVEVWPRQVRGELEESKKHNTAAYDHVVDNRFLAVAENPLSTFSTDVDTASYSILRRFLLQQRQLPPAGAVRIEELINYFPYEYPPPTGDIPFAVTTEVADCPWQADHRLVRIGLKGREIPKNERPASNLVFLIDVSGSMNQPNKLPLVQQGLRLLVEELRATDRVAIVVYAGRSGQVLPSTSGDQKGRILAAIDGLSAGGSTNGAEGIESAYEVASQNFVKGGTNRVLLATDGDFNVGVTSQDALIRLIEEKAKTGVFLTALGFGYDNLKDSTLEKLADKGNGQYGYIDDLREARKVFVDQLSGTLVTIAKDVKVQIEFNPAEVASYRLIGYENRILAKEDFNDDKKDAGDIGAGHTVTALYEIVPVAKQAEESRGRPDAQGANTQGATVDPLKYQKQIAPTDAAASGELLTLKLRYKQPDGDTSRLIETAVRDDGRRYGQASVDFRFAAGVAAFGMVLRNSPHKGNATLDAVLELVREGRGSDADGYRAELISLVERAKSIGAR